MKILHKGDEVYKICELILKSYKEGKPIQQATQPDFPIPVVWVDIHIDNHTFDPQRQYRLKPETKIRPFKDKEEFLSKLRKQNQCYILKSKHVNESYTIDNVTKDGVQTSEGFFSWSPLLVNYVFDDASVCGVFYEK